MNPLPHRGLLLVVTFIATAVSTLGDETAGAQSAHYAIVHHSVASGGGRSSSQHYESVSSINDFATETPGLSTSFVDRRGYIGQINELPVPSPDVQVARPGRPLKILKAALLSNDSDRDDSTLRFWSVPAFSSNGIPLGVLSDWVVYDAGTGNILNDSFTYTVTDGIDIATGTVTLSVVAFDGLTLNIQLQTAGADNVLRVFGIPGHNYQVQFTSDLTPPIQWSNLGAFGVAPASGLIERTDRGPFPTRFYRTIEP